MNNQTVSHRDCKCLEWKPIIAGALVIIGLTFLLNLFSVAIGLTAYTTNSDGVETLALGGLIGAAIGIVSAMFGAGWLTGYLSQRHCSKKHLGALYGFLAWCVAFLLAILVTSHIHDYVNFYTHFLSGTEVVQIQSSAASNVAITAMAQTKNVIISTYIVFALFFLSAFAASLGGHCGMQFVCKEDRLN